MGTCETPWQTWVILAFVWAGVAFQLALSWKNARLSRRIERQRIEALEDMQATLSRWSGR